MKQTPEQQYGIYHFLEKVAEGDNQDLKDSTYFQLEYTEMQGRLLFRLSGFSHENSRKEGTKIYIL